MKSFCSPCRAIATAPISLAATHLVHPEHRRPGVFDIRLEAICPDCGTRWRRTTDNQVRPVA
jgi:hypothetical protein